MQMEADVEEATQALAISADTPTSQPSLVAKPYVAEKTAPRQCRSTVFFKQFFKLVFVLVQRLFSLPSLYCY